MLGLGLEFGLGLGLRLETLMFNRLFLKMHIDHLATLPPLLPRDFEIMLPCTS